MKTKKIYCAPFKVDIEVETCSSRKTAIKKDSARFGLDLLTKEQKKCWKCKGGTVAGGKERKRFGGGIKKCPADYAHLTCTGCGKSGDKVAVFFPHAGLCRRCYQIEHSRDAYAKKLAKTAGNKK